MAKFSDNLDKQLEKRPKEIFYCKKCTLSNQRPRLTFNEDGICSACNYAEEKNSKIDWDERKKELVEICNNHRNKNGNYDILVPGSGGKDSAAVTYKLKHKYNMHPLTLTWAPFMYTDIGRKNHDDFIQSGYTNILISPNKKLHRKLSRIGFEAVGDPFLPFIYGQTALAFRIALNFGIKLIFFGENGEAEYGGSTKNNYKSHHPFENWEEYYYKGATIDDLIEWGLQNNILSEDDYTESDLEFYRMPPIDELKKANIELYWYSYFEKWLPQDNYLCASENTGFMPNPDGRSEGTYTNYASLDDKLDGIHYYMGYIKFGLGRATADTAHEIRDGTITRDEAIDLIKEYDNEFPEKYFKDSLEYMEIGEDKFWEVVNKYRSISPHLWENVDGEWILKKQIE